MSEYVGLKQGKIHEARIISEYYCGGCGWPVADHDSYCSECGGELHEGMDKSRYTELFGTPERAARTLSIMQRCELGIIGNCEECEMHDACRVRDGDYDALLGWLRGEGD